MRWVDLYGRVGRSRRKVSKHASVSSEEVKDPTKLAEIIRLMSARISELEANQPPEAVEFEFECTGSVGSPQDLKLNHNFGCPVRWYVTSWHEPTAAGHVYPAIMEHATDGSNQDTLQLEIHSTGRIVVRVERAEFGLT